MARISKKKQAAREKIDSTKAYVIDEALNLVKELATARFPESVDVSVNLGVDPRKSDQVVRGSTVLPNGTGKTVRELARERQVMAMLVQGKSAKRIAFELGLSRFPYTVEYSYEQEIRSLVYWPDWFPQEDVPVELTIEPPEAPIGKDWRVATSMRRVDAPEYGFGKYAAADYAELIDHPVEIAALTIGEFDVNGVPHAIAIRGRTRVDIARLCHDLTTLCSQHMALLGPPADLDRYLFLLHAPGSGRLIEVYFVFAQLPHPPSRVIDHDALLIGLFLAVMYVVGTKGDESFRRGGSTRMCAGR